MTTAAPHDRPAPPRPSTPSSSAREVVLDNRQVPCALGLFRLRDRMAALAPGDTVVVRSRDRFAPVEIPLWAERAGHEVVDVDRAGLWPVRTHLITVRHGGA